jgi:hypothetical protein
MEITKAQPVSHQLMKNKPNYLFPLCCDFEENSLLEGCNVDVDGTLQYARLRVFVDFAEKTIWIGYMTYLHVINSEDPYGVDKAPLDSDWYEPKDILELRDLYTPTSRSLAILKTLKKLQKVLDGYEGGVFYEDDMSPDACIHFTFFETLNPTERMHIASSPHKKIERLAF